MVQTEKKPEQLDTQAESRAPRACGFGHYEKVLKGRSDWTCALKNHSMCIVRHKLELDNRGPRGQPEDHMKNGSDLGESVIVEIKKNEWIQETLREQNFSYWWQIKYRE